MKYKINSFLIIVRNIATSIINFVRSRPSSKIIKVYGEYIYKKIGGTKFDEKNNSMQSDIYIKPIYQGLIKLEKTDADRIIEEANYEASVAVNKYNKRISDILTVCMILMNLIYRKKISAICNIINMLYHRIMPDQHREDCITSFLNNRTLTCKIIPITLLMSKNYGFEFLNSNWKIFDTLNSFIDILI